MAESSSQCPTVGFLWLAQTSGQRHYKEMPKLACRNPPKLWLQPVVVGESRPEKKYRDDPKKSMIQTDTIIELFVIFRQHASFEKDDQLSHCEKSFNSLFRIRHKWLKTCRLSLIKISPTCHRDGLDKRDGVQGLRFETASMRLSFGSCA